MVVKSELLGMLVTALSVLAAAIVSGLRLKPYIDAGLKYTPASFMIFPALIAALLVFPTVIALRRWQGSKAVIHIGPLMFRDRTPFMALWCLLYILVAVAFFPYREPAPPRAPVPAEQATSYTHPSHALPADNPHDIT